MLSHADLLSLAARLTDDYPVSDQAKKRILRYGAPLGSRIMHHHTLPRCMDLLRARILDLDPSVPATGEVVWADRLTASQGRFGRHWFAPEGGLHLAFLWADTLLPEWSRFLPFAVGLACCETVRSFAPEAWLKWVNDIHIGGKKICGVLTETVIGGQGGCYHLVGVGMNVNVVDFPKNLRGSATSLRLATGRRQSVRTVFAHLLARLQWNIGLLCYGEELWLDEEIQAVQNPVLVRWNQLSDSRGRRVAFGHDLEKKTLYQGVVAGLDDQGGLIIRFADGSSVTEYSGEIEYRRD